MPLLEPVAAAAPELVQLVVLEPVILAKRGRRDETGRIRMDVTSERAAQFIEALQAQGNGAVSAATAEAYLTLADQNLSAAIGWYYETGPQCCVYFAQGVLCSLLSSWHPSTRNNAGGEINPDCLQPHRVEAHRHPAPPPPPGSGSEGGGTTNDDPIDLVGGASSSGDA